MDVVINYYFWQGLQSYDIVTHSHTFVSMADEGPNQRQQNRKITNSTHFNKYFKDISTLPCRESRSTITIPILEMKQTG